MIFIVKEGINTLLITKNYSDAKYFYFKKVSYKRAQSNRTIKLLVHFATAEYPRTRFSF